MLFRPVYLKGEKMKEPPILKRAPPLPLPPPLPLDMPLRRRPVELNPPSPPVEDPCAGPPPFADEMARYHLPLVVCGPCFAAVIPKAATRDVLAGRVDFRLVDERGVTTFRRQHLFSVLQLDDKRKERYSTFSCVGAHERRLERPPPPPRVPSYRRRYLSPELVGAGIYGGNASRTTMSPSTRSRSSGGSRA